MPLFQSVCVTRAMTNGYDTGSPCFLVLSHLADLIRSNMEIAAVKSRPQHPNKIHYQLITCDILQVADFGIVMLVFQPYMLEIRNSLRGSIFQKFLKRLVSVLDCYSFLH